MTTAVYTYIGTLSLPQNFLHKGAPVSSFDKCQAN